MKSLKTTLITLCLICLVCPRTFTASEPTMTAEERAKAVKLLKDSEAETLAALEKLSDEQLNFKESPDRWSILEICEHISLAEGLLFGTVEKALASEPNPDWETKTKAKNELVEKAVVNRSVKVKAPEMLVPSGKLSRAEILARYKEARGKTLKFAEETELPLKAHTLDHPFPIFGTLNAYQWLIYVPLHNLRHNQQIAEVKANPNFPKK